jgi:putative ABC transport system permease protein
MTGSRSFAAWKSELRFAVRTLLRRPSLSLLAVLTLAVGIGGITAIFSVVNVVLLNPLPFPNSEELVLVWGRAGDQRFSEGFASYPDFRDWKEQATSLTGLAAFWTFPNGDVNLSGGSDPERVAVARITPGFFEVLGIRPLHGRTFQEEETIVGNHRRAILSHRLWQRSFGGDTALVGRSVMVNGFPYTVVGIMPPQLSTMGVSLLATDVDLWRPLVPEDNQTGGRDERKLRVIGRLSDGVLPGQAQAELNEVGSRLAALYPNTNAQVGVRVAPLRDQVTSGARRGLVFLLGAVAAALLAACVNVSNLLLMKSAATRHQMAIQTALGASRRRLAAQALTESLVLSIVGGVLGLVVARWGVAGFITAGPSDVPLLSQVRIDGSVLGFALLITGVTVFAVGLLPALRAGGNEDPNALRQGSSSTAPIVRRVMRLLTVAQIAIAMVLLSTAGQLVRTFQSLLRLDPGLNAVNLLTFQLELPMGAGMPYMAQPTRDVFFSELMDRIAAVPGVRGVTLANAPPIEEEPQTTSFTRPGQSQTANYQANLRLVAPNYFMTLGIPVLEGRSFEPGDQRSTPRVALLSESLARAGWGTRSPVGDRIGLRGSGVGEIVGVVGDVVGAGLDVEPTRMVYIPANQWGYNFMTLLVRTDGDPLLHLPAIREVVATQDASLPLFRVQTVKAMMAGSVATQRFQAIVVSGFSLLALLLALIGAYGVASTGVSQRSGEMGIRMAVGASAADIKTMVLRETARLSLVGAAAGALGGWILSRGLSRFLVGVAPADPMTMLLVSLLLVGATVAATLPPARRATRVDPMSVLRSE